MPVFLYILIFLETQIFILNSYTTKLITFLSKALKHIFLILLIDATQIRKNKIYQVSRKGDLHPQNIQ